jgi:uncharacterized protein YcaQ
METISQKTARKLALHAQGLLQSNPFGSGEKGALACIGHLGYIQIDTISVVQRAHHHVLWSRVKNYTPEMLDRLLQKRAVFEYWSHAAACLPMADDRFYLPLMHAHRNGELHWFQKDQKLMNFVLDRIKAEGALAARDFQNPDEKRKEGWWKWKPAKKALEQLFVEGRLVVCERVNFQKRYDLPERVLPNDLDLTMPSKLEMAKFFILAAIRAHGLVTGQEIYYQRAILRPHVKTGLAELLEAGDIIKINIENIPDRTYYAFPNRLDQMEKLRRRNNVTVLSPFDNAMIQRKRAQKLFDFDYQLECYVPAPKRKYGYFCLPILWGDRFLGRLDAKADRPNRVLAIRNLVIEAEFKKSGRYLPALPKALWQFAEFNGCDAMQIERTVPENLAKEILK